MNGKALLVFDSPFSPPPGYEFKEELKEKDWNAERAILKALIDNGHRVRALGLHSDLRVLIDEVRTHKPGVVFNCTEVFRQKSRLDKNIAWILEALEVPYTGASPANLLVCNDKPLCKKILTFHKIRNPVFQTFRRGTEARSAARLKFPVIVKPATEEASRGISQSSVVESTQALLDRIRFIHESMKADAIAEEYIGGRELYVSMIGNERIQALPFREILFEKVPEDAPHVATYRAKWDDIYRKKWGIRNVAAEGIDETTSKRVIEACKRAYRALNMKAYARFDVRVTPMGEIHILEANANPSLAPDDELPLSAAKAGISYPQLIEKIVHLALTQKT